MNVLGVPGATVARFRPVLQAMVGAYAKFHVFQVLISTDFVKKSYFRTYSQCDIQLLLFTLLQVS